MQFKFVVESGPFPLWDIYGERIGNLETLLLVFPWSYSFMDLGNISPLSGMALHSGDELSDPWRSKGHCQV